MSNPFGFPLRDPRDWSRRDFLKASSALAAVSALVNLAGCGVGANAPSFNPASANNVAGGGGGTTPAPTPTPIPNQLVQPQVRQSANGLLNTQFNIALSTVQVGDVSFVTRCYEGVVPGPTLRVNPGDEMRILMSNNLPPNPDSGPPVNINVPHQFNTTNLHTHGLHVSPNAPQDDVLIQIDPGTTFQFDFQFPSFHWDGTFFYHAHRHGSTTTQVMNGMAGALIMNGPTNAVPEIAAAKDVVMVLQDFREANGAALDFNTLGNAPPLLAINGQVNPTIVMYPGEVQRWRFVNAGFFLFFNLGLDSHVMHQIAQDGITFPSVRDMPNVVLSPGNRADVLIKAQSPGVYVLRSLGFDQGFGSITTSMPLATVIVLDLVLPEMQLPTTLPAPSILSFNFPTIDNTRQLTFSEAFNPNFNVFISASPGAPPLQFDPNRVDQTMQLGAVEEWTILNTSGDAHPFHIHVNPFLVTEINNTPLPQPVWMDTVGLPSQVGNTPGQVKFRTRFQTFTGQFVLHCHFLQHEDTGMMELVQVV